MNKFSEKEWNEDFQEFVQSQGLPVPDDVSQGVLERVRADLNPSAWTVFAKLAGGHAVIGTLSLAICNQFGLNPFRTGFSLSDYFMTFGHSTCMVLCGVLFLSLSVFLCRLLIQPEEGRVLRRNAWLQSFGLSAISLGVFAILGAEITLTVGGLWGLGAIVGGSLTAVLGGERLPRPTPS